MLKERGKKKDSSKNVPAVCSKSTLLYLTIFEKRNTVLSLSNLTFRPEEQITKVNMLIQSEILIGVIEHVCVFLLNS
jgi:hypothetical protein